MVTNRSTSAPFGSDIDPQSLYVQLGRLVETMPAFDGQDLSFEDRQWLARTYALVSEGGSKSEAAALQFATANLENFDRSIYNAAKATIINITLRALAVAELRAPAAAQGAFIPVGNAHDAFVAVGKVLASAMTDVLIIDPYLDGRALTDFAVSANEQVSVRLLADEHAVKPTLKPAVETWIKQYAARRPLEAKLASARTLHDRIIIADASEAWVLTQSLNSFATRSPATIVRVDGETAALKNAAYGEIWNTARRI